MKIATLPQSKAQLDALRAATAPDDSTSHTHEDIKPADSWEQPIPFGSAQTPLISPDLLPGIFGEYTAALAESLQVSPTMTSMFCLAVLSVALQRKFTVSLHGDYFEPVCIWTALLAESGERKSAVIQRLLAPVILWEAKRSEAMKPEITEAETLRVINGKRVEKLQGEAAKEENPVRRGVLVREI